MYSIAVKIEGMDRQRRTTGLLHLIIGFYLLVKSLDLPAHSPVKNFLPLLPFTVIGLLSLLYGVFRRRVDVTAKYNGFFRILQFITFFSFGALLLRLGLGLDAVTLFIWSVITLLLYYSEKKIFAPSVIMLSETGVKVPGTYKEHLMPWVIFEEVVVRADFITLQHRGKKYLQYQVVQDLSELEVVKINAFCKTQLAYSITDTETK